MKSHATPRPDPAEPQAWPQDAVEVGRVAGAWGVHGWVRIQPHAKVPEALLHARRWYLRWPPAAGPDAVPPGPPRQDQAVQVAQVRAHGAAVVARWPGLDDRTAAEALKGAGVWVARADFPCPAADEYYWVDLIGLAVVNRAGESLGTVTALFDSGAQTVLQVREPGAGAPVREHLIPFVAAYVDAVDLAGRHLRVDWDRDF